MRIHTNTDDAPRLVLDALKRAQRAGRVTAYADFDKLKPGRSQTHQSAVDVHLVSLVRDDQHKRRPNSGTVGADGLLNDVYALTWDEWGWFLAEVFAADPTAKTTYDRSALAFHARTKGAFALVPERA